MRKRKDPKKVAEYNASRRANFPELYHDLEVRRYAENKEAEVARNSDYRGRNRDRLRSYDLQRKYGITSEDYNRMFAEQNGVCAICTHPELDRRLSVDHCHETGRVRALLCAKCNRFLGVYKDKVDLFQRVVDYLRKHS